MLPIRTLFGLPLLVFGLAACTYSQREPVLGGERHTVRADLPADLQAVLRTCAGRLTFTAGQTELLGLRDLLPNCTDAAGDFDATALDQAEPDRTVVLRRILLAGTLAGQVDQPFDQPIPAALQRVEVVDQGLALMAWVIPLLEASLANDGIPAPARDAMLAIAVPVLSGETCRLTATVDVRFRRLGLERMRLDYSRLEQEPSLRFRADIDADRAVAAFTIDPEYRCLGSNANLLHGLLRLLFAGRTHLAHVEDGDVRLDVVLRPLEGRIAGETRLDVDVDAIRVGKPFDWIPDEAWADMLADFEVTAPAVAAQAQDRVGPSLAGLGEQVAALLSEGLDIADGMDVRGIDLDDATPANLLVHARLRGCQVVAGRLLCWLRPVLPWRFRP
jgi:hypothetical protein